MKKSLVAVLAIAVATGSQACVVNEACYNNADCPRGKVCDIPQGKKSGTCVSKCFSSNDCTDGHVCDLASKKCVPGECQIDQDCHPRFECVDWICVSREPLVCPEGMVPIENQFCIDSFEASRPDASETSAGSLSTTAQSVPNVMPWQVFSNEEALTACQAAGKTLCTERQWYLACSGSKPQVYSYGNTYSATKCNGIDTYCWCGAGTACKDKDPCPYPHCFDTCGAGFRLEPCGVFSSCTNAYGVFDINGNLWEHVLFGDGTRVRGGAYNCMDSEQLHRCDYVPGDWEPSRQGFRCCSLGLDDQEDQISNGLQL